MKISEMNAHQLAAFKLMVSEFNDLIGGLENTLLDNAEDSDNYKEAFEALHGHEYLKNIIYQETVSEAHARVYAVHIGFAGKDWLLERIEKRLVKEGY